MFPPPICAQFNNLTEPVGHTIGRNTVKRILLDNGFDPAPLRH
jgi:hypothetical protein